MSSDLLDQVKAEWVKFKETGDSIQGTVTAVTQRDFHEYDPNLKGPKPEPKLFKSGDVVQEVLVNLEDKNGEAYVIPVRQSSDLFKKFKATGVSFSNLVGKEIRVEHIGRANTKPAHTAAHLHSVEVVGSDVPASVGALLK